MKKTSIVVAVLLLLSSMVLLSPVTLSAYQTQTIRPNGDGSPLQWTVYYPIPPPPPVPHWQAVDDIIPDEVDYVWTDKTDYVDTFAMGDVSLPSGTYIGYLTFYCTAKKVTTDINTLQIQVYPVGWGSTPTAFTLTTSYQTFSWSVYAVNGLPITESDVNSLTVAIKSTIPVGVKNSMRCTQVYAEVYYEYLPTITGEVPTNGSVGVSVVPLLNIKVDDADGDSLDVYWLSNSSGSWVQFAKNLSVDTSGGSVVLYQTNSNFSGYSTVYWWSVHATDGYWWTNKTFHFTTRPETAPALSGECPVNGSVNVEETPVMGITVNDAEGDTMSVYWHSNSSGTWQQFGANGSVGNGTYRQVGSNFSVCGKMYHWRVCAWDGVLWTNGTYHFTVSKLIVDNESPGNGSTVLDFDESYGVNTSVNVTYSDWNETQEYEHWFNSGTPVQFKHIGEDDWYGQTFTVGSTGPNELFYIKQVCPEIAGGGTLYAYLREGTTCLGPNLAEGSIVDPTGTEYINLTPYPCQASGQYSLIFCAPDEPSWSFMFSVRNGYGGGVGMSSSDGGQSWSSSIDFRSFSIMGTNFSVVLEFYSNSSGAWQQYNKTVYVVENGTASVSNINFSGLNERYWWNASATDGDIFVNKSYWFDMSPLIIYNPVPANESTNVAYSSTTGVTTQFSVRSCNLLEVNRSDSQLYENSSVANMAPAIGIYGDNWKAQAFTVGAVGADESFGFTHVELNISKAGSPTGDFIVLIKRNNSKTSSGAIVSNGSYPLSSIGADMAWYQINMTPTTLIKGERYAVICHIEGSSSSGNHIIWGQRNIAPLYTGGGSFYSSDASATWSDEDATKIHPFQVWGLQFGTNVSWSNTVNVTLKSNSSGPCLQYGFITAFANSTYSCQNVNFSSASTKYWWVVSGFISLDDVWVNHTYHFTTVYSLIFSINITAFSFGVVYPDTLVYSNSSGGPDTMRLYNNGTCDIDISINGTNAMGEGVSPWVLSDTNGDNLYKMEVYNSSTGWRQINLTVDTWYDNLLASTNITANIRITTPTIFYSGKTMSSTIYMWASVH